MPVGFGCDGSGVREAVRAMGRMKAVLVACVAGWVVGAGSVRGSDAVGDGERPGPADESVASDRGSGGAPADLAGALSPPRATRVAVNLGLERRFDAGLNGPAGEVSVTRAGGGFDVSRVVDEDLSLSFGFDGIVSEWDFEDAGGLLPGLGVVDGDDPFGTLTRWTASVGGSYRTGDRSRVFGSLGVSAGYENGAEFGESLEYSGLVALTHRATETLTLAGGVVVSSELEDDVRVRPAVGVDWRFSERWRLSSLAGRGRPADRAALAGGLSVDLSYEAHETLTVFGRAAWESSSFRLDDGNRFLPGGVLRREALEVLVGVDGRVGSGLHVRVSGGAAG